MGASCDAIYDQFGAIRNPNSGPIARKSYIFLTVTFYFTKTENKTKKSLTELSRY